MSEYSHMTDDQISDRMHELAYYMNNCNSSGAEDRYQSEYNGLLHEQMRRDELKKQQNS